MAREKSSSVAHSAAHAFVGRARELEELQVGLTDALAGRGRLFLLVGEPGIGKTRLADELAIDAANRGAQVLWGRCWEDGSAPAYWPWVEILRARFRDGDARALVAELGAGAVHIAQIMPAVREQLPDLPIEPAPSPFDSAQARFPLFDAVATLLIKAATRRPLVLIFDDLHAADPPSLLLLQFVARGLRDARILIIGTYRAVEVQRQQERAQILGGVARSGHRIPLSGWSPAEVGRFIENAVAPSPSHALSPALVATVHRTTEGNPFFVDEVVRLLVSEGRAQLSDDGAAGDLRIPHGVREAIRERLRPLSAECAQIVAAAAVIGREFDLACLQEVCGLPTDRLLNTLNEALAGGIVAKLPGTLARYSFDHALIRETLYDDVLPAQRMQLHQRVGETLERFYAQHLEPQRLAELAHHFLEALPGGAVEKAVEYGTQAGARAAAQLAYEDAAPHYERALQALALHPTPDAARQCELLLALGDVQVRLSRRASRETFQRAAALARSLAVPAQLARAALGFADLGLGVPTSAPDEQVLALLEDALQHLAADDSLLRVRLLARLAAEISVSDDRQRAAALSEEAVAMARRLGSATTLASALSARHFVLWRSDYIADRLGIASEVVRMADALGNRELAIQGRTWRLLDLTGLGEFQTFDAEMETYARAADALRQPRYLWLTLNFRAMRALWRGDFTQAESFAQQALALGERTNDETTRINPWIQIFVIRREQGQLAQQEAMTKLAAERFPSSPVPRTLLALLYCELDRDVEARVELDRVATQNFEDLQRERRLGVLPYLCEVCCILGDTRRAAALYELLLPYARSNVPYGASICFGSATHYLGMLATTLSRWEEAARYFEDALARHQRMDGKPFVARTQYEYARMLLAENGAVNHEKALVFLNKALDTARQLGMKALAQRVLALKERTHEAVSHAIGIGEQEAQPTLEHRVESEVERRTASGGGRSAAVLSFPGKREQRHGRKLGSAGGGDQRPESRDPKPPSEEGIFRLDGEYWSVGDGGAVVRLKDTKGLRYIATLLRYPGCELHVTDLVTSERPLSPPEGTAQLERMSDKQLAQLGMRTSSRGESADPILDVQAKAAYRRRLEDLRDQLDEATRFNDVDRAARMRTEIDFLTQELAKAVGLGGRNRAASSHAERVRVNVTRAIKNVVKRIGARHPQLGRYLATTVKTGAFCSYTPDPRFPITWKL